MKGDNTGAFISCRVCPLLDLFRVECSESKRCGADYSCNVHIPFCSTVMVGLSSVRGHVAQQSSAQCGTIARN